MKLTNYKTNDGICCGIYFNGYISGKEMAKAVVYELDNHVCNKSKYSIKKVTVIY